MSLRARLTASLVLVLVLSLCAGGAVAGWHALRSVRAEMQAAMEVGAQTLGNGLHEMPAGAPGAALVHLVHAFDGDRHVQAVLLDAAGRERAASRLPPPAAPVPGWFVGLLSPPLGAASFAAGGGTIVLRPYPPNEVGEVWTQLKDDCVAVGLFCGLSLLLTSLVAGHALRPLARLSLAIRAVGSGDYGVRVQAAGPPELARLAHGVNAMAARLQAAQARNARLQDQLLALQDEERADLARDLHDEIGSFLFAVHLDVAAVEQATRAGRPDEAIERAGAIRDAVAHMQAHVRAMLKRLRPANPVEVGLAPALGNLVAFWRARRPGIDFALQVAAAGDGLAAATLAAAYRLVQESLSNAIRHGDPSRVEVGIEVGGGTADDGAAGDGTMLVVQVRDDGVGLGASGGRGAGIREAATRPEAESGLGLTGMRERIEALGGTLHVAAGRHGRGLAVTARLPCAPALEDA